MGMGGESINVDEVRRLAREGRVGPDPTYHAHEKGFKFDRLVNLLCLCIRVARDHRAGHEGGHVAWSQNWAGERFRIDFNVSDEPETGRKILIVTAMQLEADS